MAQYSNTYQTGRNSGLAQKALSERMPSAFQMAQDPFKYGPGSASFQQRAAQNPSSLPLSMQPARKVGRSSMDPTRLAEQAFRSTRDPMQRLQLGTIRNNLMGPQQDELDQITASYQTGSTQAQQPPSSSTPLGSPQTAGRNAVMGAFSGQRNPALAGFNQAMGRTNFGQGKGVLLPSNQPITILR